VSRYGFGDVACSFGSDLVAAPQERSRAAAGDDADRRHVPIDGAFDDHSEVAARGPAALDDPGRFGHVGAQVCDQHLREGSSLAALSAGVGCGRGKS